jgi:hypothetical protein
MSVMVQVPFGTYGQRVSRIAPEAGPQHYKTYGMSMPLATHWRKATCDEVNCTAYLKGWVTTVDLDTELGRKQYELITHDKERRYSMQRPSLTLVKFVYGPGFPCFARSQHRLPLERPARLYVAGGDFRGNPLGIPARVHKRAEDWVEDFSIHQDRLKTAIERG